MARFNVDPQLASLLSHQLRHPWRPAVAVHRSTPDERRYFGFSLGLSLLNLFRYHTFTTAVRITSP
ncbi:hypothetical protein M405DRAFT_22624 [Rhizopogon salebrosus TDB-379]|nr:hypothetical protein M405DRAFT_22624 [Rhizopogon salebrosus TDB-379]